MSAFVDVSLIILLLIAAAYFAMSEIALAGSRKLKLNRLAEKGDKRARQVLALKENPGSFFSVVQIGINAVAILGGIVGEAAFTGVFADLLKYVLPEEALMSVSFACSFVLVTLLFVIFADLIPKRVAMSRPEKVAVKMVALMQLLILIFKPLVWMLSGISGFIMNLMGVPTKTNDKITNEDILATVEAGAAAGVIAPNEKSAITNVMDLESRLVPSAMTMRDFVVFFELQESYEAITRKIKEKPHDKFLVCDEDIDHVIGIVDSKELLKKYADGQPFSLKDSGLVKPVLNVPDSLTLSETLDLFKVQKTDFAVVVNEYALTVGIITLKDILWVIMGDYVPPTDDVQIVLRDDGSWLIDGATPIDDVEKTLSIARMPEEETYETIAGFMMYMLRRVPKLTDRINYEGYRFEVIDVEGARIDQVLVTRLADIEKAKKLAALEAVAQAAEAIETKKEV